MYHPPPPTVTREDSAPARPSQGWLGVPVAIVALAGAWFAVASGGARMTVPPPEAALAALGGVLRDPAFAATLTATALAAGGGFLIALFAGAVVAAVLAGSLRLGALVLVGVPAAALLPLTVAWLGSGLGLGLVGAATMAFGPIVVGFAADGAARRAGVDVGAAMALNGAVMAEFIMSSDGLGYATMHAMMQLDMAKAGAFLLVLAGLGVVAVLVVHVLFAVFVRDEHG